jgi:hypothetical protein
MKTLVQLREESRARMVACPENEGSKSFGHLLHILHGLGKMEELSLSAFEMLQEAILASGATAARLAPEVFDCDQMTSYVGKLAEEETRVAKEALEAGLISQEAHEAGFADTVKAMAEAAEREDPTLPSLQSR